MGNFDNFFDDSKPIIQTQAQAPVTEFKPNPKKGQNGVFKAVIRFIPNPINKTEKSIIKKYTVYLTNPITKAAKTVDCPCTVSEPDIIQSTFFELRNSANSVLQENAKMFSHKLNYASIIQVISCESDPSLVNKFLVWKYGMKVHEKIQTEMFPPMGESRDPFNLISGRPFMVQVKEIGGYPNYDACQFVDIAPEQSGMRIVSTDAVGQQSISVVTANTIANAQGKELVFNYIMNNMPNMDKYEYHPWTPEVTEFVNQCIQIYTNPQATLQAMSAAQNPAGAQIQQQPTYAQAAMQPMQMPTQMASPNMGQNPNFGMPAGDPMIGMNAPAPAVGLNINSIAGTTPGNFSTPQFGSEVNELINNNNAKKPTPAAAPMNLDDVLNGQIIG
ncbi:MAG: single strand DNA binding protein [Wendovervirus sonii]|uniref:Single-stranded DNA-binding protein n=1 Tax=phage Lak_Megaphage_Sonny TaxID=3109229 RepID=A0ABZ0Z6R2_9CAUD|nr:MAG: single strand DNA binding protein [phage Lak_Megaphage_Sonny]